MMLPLDVLDGHIVESYDIPRGTCPRCGSGDIRHLLIGRPPQANADPSQPVVPRDRRSPGIEHKNGMPAAPPCPRTAVSATTLARRGNA
jgi:hypothetical protein